MPPGIELRSPGQFANTLQIRPLKFAVYDWDIHIYQPLHSGRIWHKVNFQAEFNKFEFRVFLLLD